MVVIQQRRKRLDPKTGAMVWVWAKMASHPGDVDTAATHADAAYSGHIRIVEPPPSAGVLWERRTEDPVTEFLEGLLEDS